jgi:UDP-N-acetyl-D-glucosamine dehydrogenase
VYLSWKAKEFDFPARFIQLAGEVNTSMPSYVVERVGSALNDQSKSIRGAKILMLGMAYKRDVDDVRESPALEIMELLQHKGAVLSYSDPYIPRLHKMRAYDFSHMSSVDLTDEVLHASDAVLITTDHTSFDYQRIVDRARLVIDTRNATRNVTGGREKIVRA